MKMEMKVEMKFEDDDGIDKPNPSHYHPGVLEQQATRVLKNGAGKCITCGSRADLVEYEKVLKLFFVPVWRWPGKHPLMRCENCKLFFPQSLSPPSAAMDAIRCQSCAREVDPSYRYCPFCGSAL